MRQELIGRPARQRLEHGAGLDSLELAEGLLCSGEWMRTLRTLKLGEWGTKRLLARHGASLLAVRYRYDEDTREHLKTVELIVRRRSRAAPRAASPASGSLEREAESNGSRKPGGRAAVAAAQRVALRIGFRERDLQRRVKSAGGRWDPDRRVRFVRRDVAERLDLLGRVVGGGF